MIRLGLFILLTVGSFLGVSQGYDDAVQKLEFIYEQKEFERVLALADSLLENNGTPFISRVNQIKGDAFYFLNDVESSLEHYLKALSASESLPLHPYNEMECNSHIGFCYRYLGRFIEAIPYYQQAYNFTVEKRDSLEIANQASGLGTIYSNLGEYGKASKFFKEAYEIDFALKDTVALAYDLVNLGSLHLAMKDAKKAIAYFKEGITVKRTIAGDHTIHIQRGSKLSRAFLMANELDSALYYANWAEEESTILKDSLSLAKLWIIKSQIYAQKGAYIKALDLAKRACDFFQASPNSNFVNASNVLADAYLGLHNYSEARSTLTKAYEVSKDLGLIESTMAILKKRSEIHEKQAQFRDANQDLKMFQVLNDSMLGRQKQQAILMLDQEYQTAQRNAEIEKLSLQNNLQTVTLAKSRNAQIAIGIGALMTIMILAVYFNQRHKKLNVQREVQQLQIEALEKRLIDLNVTPQKLTTDAVDELNDKIHTPLSEREFEVLKLSLEGKSNHEISEDLFISTSTVKFHLRNTYGKLGVNNRKEALDYVVKSS